VWDVFLFLWENGIEPGTWYRIAQMKPESTDPAEGKE